MHHIEYQKYMFIKSYTCGFAFYRCYTTTYTDVAVKKILQYLKPLFVWDIEGEWTLNGLPHIIDWFNRAAVAVNDRGKRRVARAKYRVNYNVDQKKLSAIYEFAKAMPSMFIPTSHTTVDDDGNNKKKRKRDYALD